MKFKNIQWLTGSLMTAALAAGISACSDDHFDIVNISPDVSGTQTIWQNIESNSELSDFADILKSVNYSQSEEKATPQTYADVLNGVQTFTVWAPVNGSFDYEYYKDLLATGERENIYKVEKELIRNHMTRYRNVINGSDSTKIELFNNKTVWLNYNENTIKGIAITKPNIGSKNGVLHITAAPVAYQPNLYEYLATRSDLDSLYNFLKGFQTVEFNEAASTQGPTIDGKITWVDSITYVTNDYINNYMGRNSGAYIEREDSSYAMVMPTNEAWAELLEKTEKYFKFNASYQQKVSSITEAGEDTLVDGKKYEFTQAELDSMVNLYKKNAICQDLVFNANWQYKRAPIATIADILKVDSIQTTAGTEFKKAGTRTPSDKSNVIEVSDFSELFGGEDPVKVSNGYAYVTNKFAYPYQTFAPNIDENSYESCTTSSGFVSQSEAKTYVNPTYIVGEDTLQADSTFKYTVHELHGRGANSRPTINMKLTNVLSCKYDIYVVVNYNTDYNQPNRIRVNIMYDNEKGRLKSSEALRNPENNDRNFINRDIHLNDKGELEFTDTILVAQDFEFPVSYYGLKEAYPVIEITNYPDSGSKTYAPVLWVNSIIMKSKEW